MKARDILAHRRQEIILINEVQRQSLILQVQMAKARFDSVSNGWHMIRRMADNPLISAGLLLGIIALKPSRIQAAASQTFSVWQRIRLWLPLLSQLMHRNKTA